MFQAIFRKASLSAKALLSAKASLSPKAMLLGALVATAPLLAVADDTDIYNNKDALRNVRPNVLLVLDTSGSMNEKVPGSTDIRIQVMRDALEKILKDESLHGQVNIGLARFNNTTGSVIYPAVELNDANAKTLIDRLKNHMGPTGNTPLVPAFYEGVRYMLGMKVDGGLSRGGQSTAERISHEDTLEGGSWSKATSSLCKSKDSSSTSCRDEKWLGEPTYISPIENACQPNHIVVLTDGEANRNNAKSAIETFIGASCQDKRSNMECANDLARHLYTGKPTVTIEGKPVAVSIVTHTIAFADIDTHLEDIAEAGGGQYFAASDASNLAEAFTTLFDSFAEINTTFAAPSATVNQFNRLNHLDDIYFAVFRPGGTVAWPGNVKKYRLATGESGQEDNGEARIVDANTIVDRHGKPAVDPETGFFLDDSSDFWSTSNPEVYQVTEGGAASQIVDRKVYTWIGEDLSLVTRGNGALTKDKLGIANQSDDARNQLIDWIAGIDQISEGGAVSYRKEMGDPLHSRPVVVTYGKNGDKPKLAMFFGTNDGYFRAIDADSGREYFSFVPEEMLSDMDRRRKNPRGKHIYGVDGAPTVWIKDGNNNGIIESADGDRVYVYFGFRRGGSSYYALDVTDLSNPKKLWRVPAEGQFAELGQSWSKPIKTQIRYDNDPDNDNFQPVELDVLIFAGGYDTNQDDIDTNIHRRTDSKGRAIYMVNALNGDLLWKADAAGYSDMKYSIPANVAVADTDLSGHADQMYVGDMGGQIWRFDINNDVEWNGRGQLPNGFITGQVIAKLAADNSDADARRFYQSPDIAMIKDGNVRKMVVTIGSGYRARPNEKKVQDRFYMLKIPSPYGPLPENFTPLTHDNLVDVTEAVEPDGTAITNGWWFDLENDGEKVLSTPLIVDGKVIFTTYEPTSTMIGCTVQPGKSREYVVNLLDGSAVFKVGGIVSRSRELKSGSIIDEPVIIFTEDGGGSTFLGVEQGMYDIINNRATRTFWYEKE